MKTTSAIYLSPSLLQCKPSNTYASVMKRKIDRISELPGHIIEEILSHLSTRDAVRTSLLSRKWRHKWTTSPSIVFHDWFSRPDKLSSVEEFVSAVDHVLSRHVGPIHKFELRHCETVLTKRNVDHWILRYALHSLQYLSISINFRNQKEISAALCLLRSSAPSLQELHIVEMATFKVTNVEYPNVFEADQMNFLFPKLRRVTMDRIFGFDSEIGFINCMLSASPVLETMIIKPITFSLKSRVKQSLRYERCGCIELKF